MRTELTKVNLLNTSDKSTLLVSGGVIKATGLNPIRLNDLISVDIRNNQAEVVQVVTIGTTTPTITASTRYIIKVGNTTKKNEGAQDSHRTYAVSSPSTLSGNAATDRSNIYVALAALINADPTADWTATANVGGAGVSMTITDKAGYYKNGRKGASSVFLPKNSAGTGFVQATHLSITTEAVYPFGIGADLLLQAPVIDPITGNVTDTQQELVKTALKNAVSGQNYTGFYFTSLVKGNVMTGVDGEVYIRHNQLLFVDNGTGSATTNAAGFAAALKQIEKVVYGQFSNDPSAIVDMFDSRIVFTNLAGTAVPDGVADTGQQMITADNTYVYTNIGTQTIIAPTMVATGLELDMDLTNTEGLEITPSLLANTTKSFVVGKTSFSIRAELTAADVTDGAYLIGFRKLAAYAADFNNYTDLAAIGTLAADSDAIVSVGILNNAATRSVDPSIEFLDATTVAFEVRVDEGGNVTAFVNDVSIAIESAASTPLVLDAGDEMIPFVRGVNVGGGTPDAVVSKLFSIPAVLPRTL
jgi:hypothetical protein